MWASLDDFEDRVAPIDERARRAFRRVGHETPLERIATIDEHVRHLSEAVHDFRTAATVDGFEEDQRFDACFEAFERIVYDGELALLYWEPFANTRAGEQFIAEKELHERWRVRNRALDVLIKEAEDLLRPALALVDEWRLMRGRYSREFLDDADGLPDGVMRHFKTGAELFAIEQDEMGALACLRGLEATCREIARKQKVKMTDSKGAHPLFEQDLRDVIEAFGRLRWRAGEGKVLTPARVHLLHVLRDERNARAHPAPPRTNHREIGALAVSAATGLWSDALKGRRKLKDVVVAKNW